MKLKHITSWTRENIKIGEVYKTSFEFSNYWLNKQRNESQIAAQTDDLMTLLEPIIKMTGKQFDLSFFSKEIQKTKYYSELLKEYIFEDIRHKEFSEKPSRQKSMFLLPLETDIRIYASNLGYDLKNKTLLEIEILNIDNLHFADLNFLNCNTFAHNEKEDAARNYWKGSDRRDFDIEILYVGQFRVTDFIE
jgi:hypothetical protein